jgi:hypothetical protein
MAARSAERDEEEEAALPRDELGEKLIAAGFAPNEFILNLNHALTTPAGMKLPAPYNLPSRLFRFPIETQIGKDGKRHIGLMHPCLGDHPFVKQVSRAIGGRIDLEGAPNAYGYTQAPATWWHACDLIHHGLWRELLKTQRFTTKFDILRAIVHGLDYNEGKRGKPRLSVPDAKTMLAALKAPEPPDRLGTLQLLMRPSVCQPEKGAAYWPLNSHSRDEAAAGVEAWGRVIGIDAGWFSYNRQGFLNWSPLGREVYARGPSSTHVEPGGQGAFSF